MFGNLFDIMGKLDKVKKEVKQTREKLAQTQIEHTSEDRKIKVTVTGDKQLHSLFIADDMMQDKNELEAKLLNTINQALAQAGDLQEKEVKSVISKTFGNIPGLGDLF